MGGRSTIPVEAESSKTEHSSQETEAPKASLPEQKEEVPVASQGSASSTGKAEEETGTSGT